MNFCSAVIEIVLEIFLTYRFHYNSESTVYNQRFLQTIVNHGHKLLFL